MVTGRRERRMAVRLAAERARFPLSKNSLVRSAGARQAATFLAPETAAQKSANWAAALTSTRVTRHQRSPAEGLARGAPAFVPAELPDRQPGHHIINRHAA